jgi:hypothetical protein
VRGSNRLSECEAVALPLLRRASITILAPS